MQPPLSEVTGRHSQPNVVRKAERAAEARRESADPTQRPLRKTRADALARRRKAWDARIAGATWEQAAQVAGYSHAQYAMRSIRRWREEYPEPDLDEQREVARARGEQLWQRAWRNVLEGRPGSVTAAVRVLQRQASLLGLDAPVQVDVHNPTTTEIDAWVAAVISAQNAEVAALGADVTAMGELGPGEPRDVPSDEGATDEGATGTDGETGRPPWA